jgi:hypothetical protein
MESALVNSDRLPKRCPAINSTRRQDKAPEIDRLLTGVLGFEADVIRRFKIRNSCNCLSFLLYFARLFTFEDFLFGSGFHRRCLGRFRCRRLDNVHLA